MTGRIGLVELFPMSLAELHDQPFQPVKNLALPIQKAQSAPRFDSLAIASAALAGGMPVPAFMRGAGQRDIYWRSWLETTIYRDLSRFFKYGFDPDFAFSLLEKMDEMMNKGTGTLMKRYLKAIDDLSGDEREEWHRVRRRMMYICETAAEKKVGVLVDAEETWIQDPVDALTILVMDSFNKDRVVVYNTIQHYRQDRFKFLKDCYEASFLVLDGNPIKDFKNTGKISMRIKSGMILPIFSPKSTNVQR